VIRIGGKVECRVEKNGTKKVEAIEIASSRSGTRARRGRTIREAGKDS